MSTVVWPVTAEPDGAEFRLITKSQIFSSPLSNIEATGSIPGDRWAGTLVYTNRGGTSGETLKILARQVRGAAGRITLPMWDRIAIFGTGLGTPVVSGADQTGYTLNTTGWTASQTGALKAGDFFSINGEVKMLTEDADADGSGDATLTFVPALRASPADASPLTIDTPRITCRIKGDGIPVNISANMIYGFTIDFEEIIE